MPFQLDSRRSKAKIKKKKKFLLWNVPWWAGETLNLLRVEPNINEREVPLLELVEYGSALQLYVSLVLLYWVLEYKNSNLLPRRSCGSKMFADFRKLQSLKW